MSYIGRTVSHSVQVRLPRARGHLHILEFAIKLGDEIGIRGPDHIHLRQARRPLERDDEVVERHRDWDVLYARVGYGKGERVGGGLPF